MAQGKAIGGREGSGVVCPSRMRKTAASGLAVLTLNGLLGAGLGLLEAGGVGLLRGCQHALQHGKVGSEEKDLSSVHESGWHCPGKGLRGKVRAKGRQEGACGSTLCCQSPPAQPP